MLSPLKPVMGTYEEEAHGRPAFVVRDVASVSGSVRRRRRRKETAREKDGEGSMGNESGSVEGGSVGIDR